MLLFSIFQNSLFGSFYDSAVHRVPQHELIEIQNYILNFMSDDNPENIFSLQNIFKRCNKDFGCKLGEFMSPPIVMNTIQSLIAENPDLK